MIKKILVSGGDSRFCFYLKQELNNKNIIYLSKKKLNILNYNKLIKILKRKSKNFYTYSSSFETNGNS